MVIDTKYEDLPGNVINYAKHSILDAIAITVGGSAMEVIYVKEHPKNPFTEQELIDKFKRCIPYSAYKLSDTVADSVIEALFNLEKVDDVVSALLLPLIPKQDIGFHQSYHILAAVLANSQAYS